MACHVNIFWYFKKMYPGYLLEIARAGFVVTVFVPHPLSKERIFNLAVLSALLYVQDCATNVMKNS